MYKDSLPKIFKIFFFIILLLLFSGCAPKQPQDTQVPQTVWQRTFGGSYYDFAYSIQQTKDEGYIVAGWTTSYGAGESDVYIIRLDSDGNKVWERTFGGIYDDSAYSIQQTKDEGYIVAGVTYSFGAGGSDFYIIKLDSDGNKIWERTFGGSYDDFAYSIQQTKDEGYIVAGVTYSYGAGYGDVYIIKLDSDGNKIWERTFGGSYYELAYSIQQTKDEGYIVAGVTYPYGAGYGDVYIIKLDSNGDKVWERTFGESAYDELAYSIQQTKDEGYIVAGGTYSYEAGESDFYIIKLDSDGNKVWERTFGGIYNELAYSIQQTKDEGYIVAGGTYSFGAGGSDFYIIKLDSDGNKVWERTFGGIYDDSAYSIQQTKDEGYIVAGWTSSFGEGIVDFYIIKTNSNGNTGPYPQVQGAQGVLKGFKPQETLFEKFFPQRLFKK